MKTGGFDDMVSYRNHCVCRFNNTRMERLKVDESHEDFS